MPNANYCRTPWCLKCEASTATNVFIDAMTLLSHMPIFVMIFENYIDGRSRVPNSRIHKRCSLTVLGKDFNDFFLPFFVASQLQITITTVGAGPVAGQSYTFICAVTFPMGEFNGTLQWVVPESANPISSIDGITVSRTTPYNLTINELHQSQDGKYTCQATNGSNTGSTSTILRVGGRL